MVKEEERERERKERDLKDGCFEGGLSYFFSLFRYCHWVWLVLVVIWGLGNGCEKWITSMEKPWVGKEAQKAGKKDNKALRTKIIEYS